MGYPEDSAGRIMSREFVSMPDWWTVKEAKEYLLKNEELPEDFYDIFLTDDKFHPTGQIALDKLLRAKPSQKLFDVMDGEIVPIDVMTDQEEVAHMFREYGWMSAMVVDARGHLVGVILIDDVVDVIHEEASEDIMHLSGAEEGDVYKSVFSIFKSPGGLADNQFGCDAGGFHGGAQLSGRNSPGFGFGGVDADWLLQWAELRETRRWQWWFVHWQPRS